MFASAAAAGAAQASLDVTRQLSEIRDEITVPFWVIIILVIVVIWVILCGCTCFVIRCFAPEVMQGPAWEINSYGTQWVKWTERGDGRPRTGPVVHSLSDRSYPGAIPVHEPKHNQYDPDDPDRYMRPKHYDNKNNAEFRNERREVIDRANGLYVAPGGGRLAKNNELRRQTAEP